MAFYDTLVADIKNGLAGLRTKVPSIVLLFGKDSTGEPAAVEVGASGVKIVDAGLKPPNARACATTTIAADPTDLGADTEGGFMVNVSGEWKLRLAGDTDANYITPYLLAGVRYDMVIRKAWITGSPSGAGTLKITGFAARS